MQNIQYNNTFSQRATSVGLTAALVLECIGELCQDAENKQLDQAFADGSYWAVISVADLHQHYLPFLTERRIRTALKRLQDESWIEVANHNTNLYDRTSWYRLVDP